MIKTGKAAGGTEAVVIGASAGAVAALSRVLPPLPADYPLPILIVVHQPADKPSGIRSLFASKCKLAVKEAEDKEPLLGGTVYFAPPDYHLLVEKDFLLSLSNDERVNFSRPSIDVLFESAADAYGPALLGVVLTGANHDGAKGLRRICDAGGRALVQKPDTAEARIMPEAAMALCAEASVWPLEQIAAEIARAGKLISR